MNSARLEPIKVNESQVELEEFYRELKEEKETFELSFDLIMQSYKAWVMRNDSNKIVGLSGLRKKWGCSIFYVVVKNSEQGKGLGRLLTEKGLNMRPFLTPVLLSVASSNKKAQTLYESLGMNRVLCSKTRVIMMQKAGPWQLLCYLSQFWTKGPLN